MKFCEKCGAQLFDDAVLCTQCGRMLGSARPTAKKPKSPNKADTDRFCTLISAFGFAYSVATAIAWLFLILSIALGPISSSAKVGYSSKSMYVSVFSDFRPHWELISAATVFSSIAFALALTHFIITLVNQQRGSRFFSSLSKLISSICLALTAILILLL